MKLMAKVLAVLLSAAIALSPAASSIPIYADEVAEATAEFLTAPETVTWVDESKLILGVSPVDGATGYDLQYSVPSKNFTAGMNYDNLNNLPLGTDGLYHFSVNEDMNFLESSNDKDLSGELTISVYAIKGNFQALTWTENAPHKDITTSAYVSCLSSMKATPTPTNVALSISEDNKLTVTFDEVKDEDNAGAYEYRLQFKGGDDESSTREIYCYSHDNIPSNLQWSSSNDGKITIPITDYVRETVLSDYDSSRLSVRVRARSDFVDENNKLKYKVGEWSDYSSAVDYKKADVVAVDSVSTNDFNSTGTTKTISNTEDIKKLLPSNSDVTKIEVEVKTNEKTSEFQNTAYSSLATFEVNLKSYAGESDTTGTEIHNTNTSILVTVPIPESMWGKNVIILTKHENEEIREIGSTIDWTNHTISFYTDQFSDYAIAVVDSTEQAKAATPTGVAGGQGVITGLKAGMEFRLKDSETWTAVSTDGNVSVSAGTYEVRTAASDSLAASDPIEVTVTAKQSGGSSGGGNSSSSDSTTTAKSAAAKTVSDTTATAKTAVSGSSISTEAKDAAASLIDAAKADADKAISAAKTKAEADAAAKEAEDEIKAIEARVEKAESLTDVPDTGDVKDAVQYGIVRGYINGTGNTTYSPNGDVTRAQFMAFLYRLAGSPAVEGEADFDDVEKLGDNDFSDAIKWASDNDIAEGFDDGTFRPSDTVTREQAVAFLHRYFKTIDGGDENSFGDVKTGAWYEGDINWGVGSGIVKGVSDTTFGVNNPTTRGQAAQFIYRAATK